MNGSRIAPARRVVRILVPRPARRRLRNLAEEFPTLYCAALRRDRPGRHIVDADTDIVIEAYESSGNTFARNALLHANPSIRIGSHVHKWAHVARAVELRVPVLVLLRAPDEAIASHIVRMRHVDRAAAVDAYTRFYRGVERLADEVVIAPFEVLTTRFGDVVRCVNDRFGTSFTPFDQTAPAAVAAVFERMGSLGASEAEHWRAARPNADRDAAVSAVRAELNRGSLGRRMEAAREVCQRLRGFARTCFPDAGGATDVAEHA